MKNIVNPAYLAPSKLTALNQQYSSAFPCKHIVMDNFLCEDVANALYENFPKLDTLNVKRKSLNEQKSEDYHFERFHPVFSDVKNVITCPDFCNIITKISGIDGLFVTTDNTGTGVHQGGNGSHVDIHIDFNMSTKFNAWRRLNLLIYLNKNWKPEYGGDLELWNPEMTKMEAKYAPLFNRAIIFYTDENAPHGYREMTLPEGETRKSFYCYYYTPVEEGVQYRDSMFLARPDESISKKILTKAKESVKINAKRVLFKLGVKSLDFQDKN